jgi:hypothetical protein
VQRSQREISACGRGGNNFYFSTTRNAQQNECSVALFWIGTLRIQPVGTSSRDLSHWRNVAFHFSAYSLGTLHAPEAAVQISRLKYTRFGYRRLHLLLQRSGEPVNHKRVHPVYREAGLSLRRKKRKHCERTG